MVLGGLAGGGGGGGRVMAAAAFAYACRKRTWLRKEAHTLSVRVRTSLAAHVDDSVRSVEIRMA
jgi:hypothetical protein